MVNRNFIDDYLNFVVLFLSSKLNSQNFYPSCYFSIDVRTGEVRSSKPVVRQRSATNAKLNVVFPHGTWIAHTMSEVVLVSSVDFRV